MELPLILIYGAMAGLAAGMLNSLLAPIFMIAQPADAWRKRTLMLDIALIAVHFFAGIALAALFWLSWGLTAIVSVPWWQRGLSFAALTWLAACGPILINQALSTRTRGRVAAKLMWDSLLTCALVGLACAWSWSNGR